MRHETVPVKPEQQPFSVWRSASDRHARETSGLADGRDVRSCPVADDSVDSHPFARARTPITTPTMEV
jgi:hypothetical protein